MKIDFCEGDVLDAFDEWRRAVGLPAAIEDEGAGIASPSTARGSLPAHLERAVLRLTNARATGALGDAFDGVTDRVAHELEAARAAAHGVRGRARTELLARLRTLDRELLDGARARLDASQRAAFARQVADDLAPYRTRMAPDAFARAQEAALDRLVRERFALPTLVFS